MNFRSARAPRGSVLDLTPLIDVIFQLLIFFLLTSSYVDQQQSASATVPVELPESSLEASTSPAEELVLTIDERGSVRLFPHGGCHGGRFAVHVGTRRTGPAGSWRLGQPTFAPVVQRRRGRCKPYTDDECSPRCGGGRGGARPHCSDDTRRGCVVLGQRCLWTTGHWRPRATHSSNAAEPGAL